MTTTKEGWSAYGHHLGNRLLVIAYAFGDMEAGTDEEKEKAEITIKKTWVELVGHLYLIKSRMVTCGHLDVAEQMQEIVDMVVTGDLSDRAVQVAIHDKRDEFDPGSQAFHDAVAAINSQ